MSKTPERRLRFSVEQDMQLLGEVVRQNPFEDIDRWREVHENFVNECNVPFSLRTCKDHCNHLLNLYLKDALKARPKESPDEFAKKQKYLDQILEMRRQYSAVSTPRRGPRTSTYEDTNDDELSVKKEEIDTRTDESDDDFFWDEENERDKREKEREANDVEGKLRKQELSLEQREATVKEQWRKLKEERIELEKMEKTRRTEIERAERDMYKKIAMQNQIIVNGLMDRYNKRNGGNLCIL